jgi:hypothetical protein
MVTARRAPTNSSTEQTRKVASREWRDPEEVWMEALEEAEKRIRLRQSQERQKK